MRHLFKPTTGKGTRLATLTLLVAAGLLLSGAVASAATPNPAPPRCTNWDPFPHAEFGANPNPATAGHSVTFDGSCSTAPCEIGLAACEVHGWSWDFGDGTTGSGAVTSHTYASAGTYTVTLTACECKYTPNTTTASHEVYVLAPPLK
jgi:PKD repeat protein